jgi:hypothetical protein
MISNQKRHIELLKGSQDFKNQGKNLFRENPEEYFELSEYNIAVERHIFWRDRYQVALSMEDFLNKKIDGEGLCGRFYGLRRKLINTCEKFKLKLSSGKVKDFQPYGRAKRLNGFLTALFCECDHFTEDYENDEFYTFIKNGFLNLQKALNKE